MTFERDHAIALVKLFLSLAPKMVSDYSAVRNNQGIGVGLTSKSS